MKTFVFLIVALLVAGTWLSPTSAAKANPTEEKVASIPTSEPEPIAVSGKVYFADYLTVGGKKCAAFMEAEDGSVYCVLSNEKTDSLKEKVGGRSGRVNLSGEMTMDPGGAYVIVEKYDVIDSPQPIMGPVRRKKM